MKVVFNELVCKLISITVLAQPAASSGAAPDPQTSPGMEHPSLEQEEEKVLVSKHSWQPCPKARRRLRGETLTPSFGHAELVWGSSGGLAPYCPHPGVLQGAWRW